MSSSIMTVSGKWIDFLDPNPEQITIEDIAYALARECRFANHLPDFYSVAQHSLLVSRLAENPLAGLLHDAAEAYMRDVPSPLKKLCTSFQLIERRLQEAIYRKFLGKPFDPADIHLADQVAIEAEMEYVRDGKEPSSSLVSTQMLWPVTKDVAEARFIDEFKDLYEEWGA